MPQNGLNSRQRMFAEHFALTGNATESARAAGYADSSSHVHGAKLLKNAKVMAVISELHAKRIEEVRVDQDMVLQGLLIEAKRLGEGTSHGARVTAWTQLGKHLEMFTEKQKVGGLDGGPIRIERVIVDPANTPDPDS